MDCLAGLSFDPAAAAVALSPRHFAVGADGLICICHSDVADAKMRMFNADGSGVKGEAGKAVHIDVVVAAALHFGEIQNHRDLPPPGRKRAHFARRPRFDFIIASNPGQHKENRQKNLPQALDNPS